MGKKKPLFGVSNYVKRTPKKRPGRHNKSWSKRIPKRKPSRGQGRLYIVLDKDDNILY